MSDRVRADDVVPKLREAFAMAIREVLIGTPPAQALQAADHLCDVWKALLAGVDVAMPARRKIDGVRIAEDWQRGLGIGEIMQRHGCSKQMAYYHHPSKRVRDRKAGSTKSNVPS